MSSLTAVPGSGKRLPRAIAEGAIHVGDVRISCAVLENGERVITSKGLAEALQRRGHARNEGPQEALFRGAKNVLSFADSSLTTSHNRVVFVPKQGGKHSGFRAEVLPGVCKAYLRARRAGDLREDQAHIAARCEILMEAFAEIGIIALIDEATGYQEVRQKSALQLKLELLLREKAGRWEHTFPEEFYRLIFQLKGRQFDASSVNERWLGHVTNDIVYGRLDQGVLEALNILNPTLQGKGYRREKHHQWLTEEMGRDILRIHIVKLCAWMKAAGASWWTFMRILDENCPRKGHVQLGWLFPALPEETPPPKQAHKATEN